MSSPTIRRRTAAPSERVRVRRVHEKASYDRDAVKAILDEALVAHVGFAHEGQPFVIPTLHARLGEEVYVHGSSASRTLRTAAAAVPMCLTVTLLDGIVFARSMFEMSANYRSVVVLGEARAVTDPDEKLRALQAFSEQVLPGRWEQARKPTRQELKATAVLALSLDEASAKISTGGPDDGESEDAALDVWAGHVPIRLVAGAPVPCPHLRPGISPPDEIAGYQRRLDRAGADWRGCAGARGAGVA
ncbi:MAG TPA: pyridoxamine 5'-phosphate oxidase family protein [Solirubrobacteraceae bacterium]|nr:pyridoxamine 5'-phosphate oxidase family protein [Solirubrobacteraceae bacterium]